MPFLRSRRQTAVPIYMMSALLLGIWLCAVTGCYTVKSIGKNPSDTVLAKMPKHPNFANGQFKNLPYPDDTLRAVKRGNLLKSLFNKPENVRPISPLPWVKTNLKTLPAVQPAVVWFGHSTVLIKTAGGNILIDPVFSGNAGPIPGLVKAFKGTKHYRVRDLPPIDILLISHDHYDHLDYRTVMRLKKQVKKVVVPIGVGSHFIYWGFAPDKVVELNWHESFSLGNLSITATPARHRSSRTFKTNPTLWASYVINTGGYRLFYSGDGGYGYHFEQIGQQYGPFNLALMECGQYSVNWAHSHMMPEQTAQAAADLQARVLLPVHWCKFAESDHAWRDPVNRLLPAAQQLGLQVCTPRIGEPYTLGQPLKGVWWLYLK